MLPIAFDRSNIIITIDRLLVLSLEPPADKSRANRIKSTQVDYWNVKMRFGRADAKRSITKIDATNAVYFSTLFHVSPQFIRGRLVTKHQLTQTIDKNLKHLPTISDRVRALTRSNIIITIDRPIHYHNNNGFENRVLFIILQIKTLNLDRRSLSA